MNYKELREKCKKEGKEIWKISENPIRMYKVRYKTKNSKHPNKYLYRIYIRRVCSTCKKENMVNRSVYYRKNHPAVENKIQNSNKLILGRKKRNFCSHKCRAKAISGENHYMFEEGKIVDSKNSDYIQVKTAIHPYRSKQNYVPLHRWVMEKHIGRYLRPVKRDKNRKIIDMGELVHHIDMDKRNNDLSNLMICNGMGHHQDVHASYNNICAKLMELGIVGFNSNKGYYIKKTRKEGKI